MVARTLGDAHFVAFHQSQNLISANLRRATALSFAKARRSSMGAHGVIAVRRAAQARRMALTPPREQALLVPAVELIPREVGILLASRL